MKGYLTTAIVCIILGVMMSVYFGTSQKVHEISQVLAVRNEKAANIELQMSQESLERMKLDTELKRLEFEVSSRQLSLELAELERTEQLRQETQLAEVQSEKDMVWAWTMIKIVWLAIGAFVLPLLLIVAVFIRAFYGGGEQGGGHAE